MQRKDVQIFPWEKKDERTERKKFLSNWMGRDSSLWRAFYLSLVSQHCQITHVTPLCEMLGTVWQMWWECVHFESLMWRSKGWVMCCLLIHKWRRRCEYFYSMCKCVYKVHPFEMMSLQYDCITLFPFNCTVTLVMLIFHQLCPHSVHCMCMRMCIIPCETLRFGTVLKLSAFIFALDLSKKSRH